MTRVLLLAVLSIAACSPEPRRAFPLGLLQPVSPRVAVEARRLGLVLAVQAPPGAATVSAALPARSGSGEVVADWRYLRFLAARAITSDSGGIFIRLPRTPVGHDLLEYVEEWQSVARVLRELLTMQPILERGAAAPAPFPVPAGIEMRAWTFGGRRYALIVNSSGEPAPLEAEDLRPWRALFTVRSDARELLSPCGNGQCLPVGCVLWLEGRLLPGIMP